MAGLSDKDWELVSAFHDGELSGDVLQRFKDRLPAEPALADALDQIAHSSQSLKALRPALPSASHQATQLSRKILTASAVAAMTVFGLLFWTFQIDAPRPLDLHRDLNAKSFTVTQQDIRNVALSAAFGVHDLSGANLVPVATQDIPDGRLAHYAGVNGCRLSYFKVDTAFELPAGTEAQAVAWTTADGAHHAIIATGMDLEKFDAIAVYLQTLTHDLAKADVYASLRHATDTALPCVG